MNALFLSFLLATFYVLAGAQAPLVKVELYYEALCPGCQEFITGPLAAVVGTPDLVSIITLKMIPYGNTKYNSSTDSFSCQHGVDECTSDVFEQSAIYLANGEMNLENALPVFPFLLCMEEQEGNPSFAESCYTKNIPSTEASWEEVKELADMKSNYLQSIANAATPSNHSYVPWVLVDGLLLENTELLKRQICQSYTGTKPSSCRNLDSENKNVCLNN